MLDFRPHILKAVVGTTPDTVDPLTGAVIPGSSVSVEYKCRATPNGAGKEIAVRDGSRVVYGYLIHADTGAEEIPHGTNVEIFENDVLIASGKVLRFWTNQMNTRIWI